MGLYDEILAVPSIKHAFLYVDQPVTYELSKVDTGSSIST